jgi:arylsulfatase A-like enzyme
MTNPSPNILLITTDQQRFDTVGDSAPPSLRTPHVDQFAREGVTFANAYADCPLCVPSRVSIMTGQSVFQHGMTHNGASSEVMGRENTLPSLLHGCGYQTAAVGKMHSSPQRIRHAGSTK